MKPVPPELGNGKGLSLSVSLSPQEFHEDLNPKTLISMGGGRNGRCNPKVWRDAAGSRGRQRSPAVSTRSGSLPRGFLGPACGRTSPLHPAGVYPGGRGGREFRGPSPKLGPFDSRGGADAVQLAGGRQLPGNGTCASPRVRACCSLGAISPRK